MKQSDAWPQNTILHGIHIGEHDFDPDKIIAEIEERFMKDCMNYVVIRPHDFVSAHYFYEWARYFAAHKIYFMFLYSIKVDSSGTLTSVLNPAIVSEIRKIAGEYFLGDILGEPGSSYTFKSNRYFEAAHPPLPPQGQTDMEKAKQHYVDRVGKYIQLDAANGIHEVTCVDATAFSCYNVEAGVTIPVLEMMVGNPEALIGCVRGCARARSTKSWGTYVAHEWYGGMRQADPLKQKRLQLIYNYAYMAGSSIFCLESGDELLESYGVRYEGTHAYCKQYRDEMARFGKLLQEDKRPIGGPRVKIAFVQGNLDGYSGLPTGSTLWGQLDDPKWGYGAPEYSWRILEDVSRAAGWHEAANFGNFDAGGHVPYGMFDVIPADTPPNVMAQYEYVIFAGWNTMTETIYENLTTYVKEGGRLFMTAAHLNTNTERGGAVQLIHGGDVSSLFGCVLDEAFTSKEGFKFAYESIVPDVPYPGPRDFLKDSCDPFYSAGYAAYAAARLTDGRAAAVLDDGFAAPITDDLPIALTEHKLGKGYALLLTTLDYPGAGAVYPVYKTIVKCLLNACHNSCDITVRGSDKLKFSVYEGGRVYLLNTDFECEIQAFLQYNGKEHELRLKPCEMKAIDL